MFRFLLLLVLLAASLPAQQPNPAQPEPWPREFKARPVKLKISDDTPDGSRVVTTRHFRMIAETRIGRQDLARFARVVESVPQLIRSHPLPLWARHQKDVVEIILCKDEASFVRAGANEGAVGWWDGRRGKVLIRADYFLAPPQPGNSRLQARPDQGLLVHELVHMAMSGLLWRLPPWFSEGVAEYFSVCHQGDGWYLFRDLESLIRDHLRHAISRNKVGDKFHLVPVSRILNLDHQGWIKTSQNQFNGNAYLPYATALLLVHYHFHGGANRRAITKAHLSSLPKRSTATPEFPTEPAHVIEERLVKYWSSRGLQLVFGEK